MILLSQWYEPDDTDRLAELKQVREANETSGLFRKTVYMNGEERLSFGRFFDCAAANHRGEVCVVANTDIMFDGTASMIESCCKPNRIVALTRWEWPYVTPRMLGHFVGDHFFSGSQDVWAFIGGELPQWSDVVPLGYVACDQAVAGWATMAGCEVVSPSLTIRTMHVHRAQRDAWAGSIDGWYGYPEPTIVADEYPGLVLVHEWPPKDGQENRGAIIRTCQP